MRALQIGAATLKQIRAEVTLLAPVSSWIDLRRCGMDSVFLKQKRLVALIRII